MLRLILCALWLVPLSSHAAEWPAYSGDLDEFDNIQRLPAGEGPDRPRARRPRRPAPRL